MKPREIDLTIIKEYRPFLLPVLIIAMIILSGLLVLKPKLGEVLAMREKLSVEREKLARTTQKLAALEGLNEVELSEKVEETLKFLPADKDLPGALVALRGLSRATGLELTDVKVSPGVISTESAEFKKEKKGEIPSLAFQITVQGGAGAAKEFLDRVVSTAPLMRVGEIKLSSKEGSPERTDINLDIFYLPPPEVLGSVESPLPAITDQEEKTYQSLKKIEVFQAEAEIAPMVFGKENPFSL